jgi:hypothetical protein
MKKLFLTTVFASAAAFVVGSNPANAAGCGGYVNLLQWGCAPWDNNPPKPGVTPGYPAVAPKAVAVPAAAVISNDGGSLTRAAAPVVSNDGGSFVGNNGSALVSNAGGTLVSNAGGTLVGNAGGTLVGNAGGTLVGNAGGTLVGNAGGTLVGNAGGTLVGNAGGTLVGNAGGTLVGNAGGTLVGNAGGTLVGNAGGTLVSNAGGTAISDNGSGIIARDGAGIIARDGAGVIARDGAGIIGDGGASLTIRGPSAYTAVAPVVPAADQAALNAAQAASQTLLQLSAQAKQDAVDLAGLSKSTDQSVVLQLQAKLDKDTAAAKTAGVDFATKVTTIPDGSPVAAAVQTLVNSTGSAVLDYANTAKAATDAAAAPIQPSALQTATAAAAAAKAADAAKAAADLNSQVQALTATLGSRPTNTADLLQVNQAMAASALVTAKAGLAKAQSDLVAMSAKGASAYDIQGQKDLVTKAQTNVTYQASMVANDYAGKAIAADTARTDLASAKSVVDGLTTAYGSNRPADPQQLATINAAMVVQALAQDKADLTNAAATAVRLSANGASKSDIQTQVDLVATKQTDMTNILKVNPQILAAAGVAGNTDPALVSKAITGLVTTAAKQTSAAVQQTAAAVQTANATLQQAQTTPVSAASASPAALSDLAAIGNSLKTTAASYSIKSVDAPTQVASAAAGNVAAASVAAPVNQSELTPAMVQMLVQSGPATIAAMQSAQQAALAKGDKATADGLGKDIVNFQAQVAAAKAMPAPAATPAAAPAPTVVASAPVAAVAPAPVVVAAPVNQSELTPAVVQMLVQSGPATIQAMQAAQQAALAKGDKTMADGLAKDITSLQAQVAAAKAMPAPAATPTAVAAATPASPAVAANPTAAAPVVVANASPTTAAPAGAAATAPAKISNEQSKAVQQALRTIPGDLSKADQKSFAALSAMVDRATTKGLTPDEANYLKEGIEALAAKHPKAEKQQGLTKIANTVAVQKPVVATTPAGSAGTTPIAIVTPNAVLAPNGKAQGPNPQTRAPEQGVPKSASATPAVSLPPAAPKTELRMEPRPENKPAVVSTTPAVVQPAKPSSTHEMHIETKPAVASTTPHAAPMQPPAATHQMRVEPKVVAPVVRTTPPVVTAPKPPAPAMAAAKPAAPKAPTCTPNMVAGKMVGMICH